VLFGRVSRIVFDILGTLFVLLVIGAGLLSWRLSLGPLSLGFMTPLIERALSDEAGSITVAVDDTVLTWAGWRRTFDVRVHGLRALGQDGRLMLEVPEVSISLSARALLHGLVAPTSLEAIGVQLVLVRTADGTWQFKTEESAEDGQSALPMLLDDLLAPPDPTRSLGYIRSASALNASVTVVDEVSHRTFVTHDVQVLLQRDEGGLRGQLAAVADISGKSASFSATGHYAAASGTLSATFNFTQVDPTALASIAPQLAPLGGFDVPLSGHIAVGFDPQFRLADAGFDISGENGRLDAATYHLPQTVNVRRLQVRGRLPVGLSALSIDEARLDLGGPIVSFRGQLVDMDSQPRAQGTVTARNVATDDLRRLWPYGAGENARRWITENLSGGAVSEATAEIAASSPAPSSPWTVSQLAGALKFSGVEVSYLPPMPHVQGVDGSAKFSRSRFDIDIASGGLGDLKVARAQIALTALDTDNETADVDVAVNGPLRQMLDLVDGEPLGYMKKIDLKPADFSGDASVRLVLKFPLKKDLKVDQLAVVATGEVQNLSQQKAALGQDVSDGQVRVRIDRDGMDIAGRVTLGPVPAEIELRRNFADRAPIVGRTRARGRVADAADRARFGFDFAPYVEGPTDLSVDYVERQGGRSDVTVDATLDDATLTVPELDWTKAAGTAARARAVVDLAGGRALDISRFTVASGDPAAGGLAAQGRLEFASDGRTISRVDFDALKVGRTDAHGTVRRGPDGLSVDFAGAAFNAEPFLSDTTPSTPNRPPLELRLELGRLYFASDRVLDDLHFRGRRGSERWESADLAAHTEGSAPSSRDAVLTLQMLDDGRQKLDMVVDDAGEFLKAIGVTPNMIGGRLEASGATDMTRPERPLLGRLHISSYRVKRAPVLARLLSVALLTGIVDTLTGQGIRFAQLDADFAYLGPTIEVIDARSAGPAMGLTAKGTIGIDADTIDLTGTVVPANALNSLPEKIPLIGNLITGGGGGLFAAAYKISGPTSDPKTSVNPLSTLAPGFLRNLFGRMGGKSPGDSTPESEKEIEREQPKQPPGQPAPSPP
jgi:Protein of unknown function/AsmA-like C-terminal region